MKKNPFKGNSPTTPFIRRGAARPLINLMDAKEHLQELGTITTKQRIEYRDDPEKYRCHYCMKWRPIKDFYKTRDPYAKSGITPACKDCIKRIADRDEMGEVKGMTVDSLLEVLRILDMPFSNDAFDRALRTAKEKGTSTLSEYMKLYNFGGSVRHLRFSDSERRELGSLSVRTEEEMDECKLNQMDAIRLLGYDPFTGESESDKPLLYAKLVGFLSASPDANDDEMKMSSIIHIVREFNHADKIAQVITKYTADVSSLQTHIGEIRTLESAQKDIMATILKLAEDSGISLKHNNSRSKGANTLSGKLREMKELNLREVEVNSFDIETSYGMKQVADISNKSILEQIRLNENDFPEMLAEQRLLIEQLQAERDAAEERARILIRENDDLKRMLPEHVVAENTVEA